MKVIFCKISSKSVKISLVLLFIIAVIFISRINKLIHCDEYISTQLVKTPEGSVIPKFDQTVMVIPFSNLSGPCHYAASNSVSCPDVRKKGETVLRQVQLVIVRMLKVIDIICQKHSINYWIMSGTLLGAHRHKTIIPWDNDADIGLLEEDYVKLVEAFRADLPEDYFFQTIETDPEFSKNGWIKAKVRDRNSCYGHCIRRACTWHDGIQTDIFVFKRSNPDSDEIVSVTTGRFKLNVADILPTTRISFEGVKVSAPKRTEIVLERLFGESYMTPVSSQCPENGFMAIPWYSCEYMKSLPATELKQVLEDSMVHSSWFFWYFG